MIEVSIIHHIKGSPGFRRFGLGPRLYPCRGIDQLQKLFNNNSFWAKQRSKEDIKKMLKNSDVIITLWIKHKLIGFGRANTDTIYRATLWDIIVKKNLQNRGYGKLIVSTLLNSRELVNVEKIYLMSTKQENFYQGCGFKINKHQKLLFKEVD